MVFKGWVSPSKKYCTHRSCQDEARAELEALAVITQAKDPGKAHECRMAAFNIKNLELIVRCRKVPRKGAVDAPFPGEKLG